VDEVVKLTISEIKNQKPWIFEILGGNIWKS
jgi:hypothetical protein